MQTIKRITLGGLLLWALGAGAAQPAINDFAEKTPLIGNPKRTGVAIRGYDTVAYFTQNAAVKGTDAFSTDWNGVRWKFSSAENLEKFKADPQRYAPQYGGYCAYGVTKGYLVKVEPDQFAVVNGKLYLNYDKDVQKTWSKDISGYIQKADAKFADLLKE